jgi:hypothetical protein
MSSGSETQKTTIPKYQQDYVQNILLPAATRVGTGTATPYTGSLTAAVDPNIAKATDLYGQIAATSNRTPEDWQNLYARNMSGYTSAVMNPAMAEMDRKRQQQLVSENAKIIGSGAFDSSRRGVFEGESSAGYGISRDKMIADLMREGYSEAMATTMAQYNAQNNAASTGASGFMATGGVNMATEQAEKTAQYDEFLRQQNDIYARLNALIGGSGAMPNQSSITTTKKNGLLDYLTVGAKLLPVPKV